MQHMSLITIERTTANPLFFFFKWKSRSTKQLFFLNSMVSISLLFFVVWFGMHKSSFVPDIFNYWNKPSYDCIWKTDNATICQLALPRQ